MTEVLGHEIDFLRALRLELLRFADQAGKRLGAVLAAHQRDRAEGAGVIAAFGDLEIAHMRLTPEELTHAGVRCNGILDETALRQLGDEAMQL